MLSTLVPAADVATIIGPAPARREGILSTIGHTPLLRLSRILPGLQFRLFAKLEAFNPGGSIKDRVALSMLEHAFADGRLQHGGTVIESSSGNLGIGLAQACAYWGLRFICVVDPKTTRQNIAILEAYGAEIDLVSEPDPRTGEYLQARIDRVKQLQRAIPNSFWPDQYSNLHNPLAHYHTMHEIATELDGQVDYLFCATSTCGTLRGCSEYIRQQGLDTKIVAVDAVGSVIFGQPSRTRLIPGHGAARRPELFSPGLADECVHVSDRDCVVGCRKLLRREALLCGGSSGGVLSAVEQVMHTIPARATVAVILCDRGERYLDTIYSDSWVREHFGNLNPLVDR